jgi:hypothetical protein
MSVARDLAINGFAQDSAWKEKNSGKVDQRRKGEFVTKEEDAPGEELRMEAQNAIRTGASEEDRKSGVAASDCELESVESRRDCWVGIAVSKDSAGRQVGAIAAASTVEPREGLVE